MSAEHPYPRVIGRATEDNHEAITVRPSEKPNDVMHLDLKRAEHMTDLEACLAAACLRCDWPAAERLAEEIDAAGQPD